MRKHIYSFSLPVPENFDSIIKEKSSYLKVIETNYSIIYDTGAAKYVFNNEYFGLGAFKILQLVKSDVKQNLQNNKFKLVKVKPQYYNYNPKYFQSSESKILFTNELDLNSAYLESAYLQKIISKEIYTRLKTVSKKMRLRALGSLATRKFITEYESGQKISYEIFQDIELREVWNMICKGTDELIYNIIYAHEKYYIFYWFDNLFLHEKIKDDIFYKQNTPLSLSYVKNGDQINIRVDETGKSFILPY